MMVSGVRPIISLAEFPTDKTFLSISETATTDGSLRTMPLPGTNTKVLAVPKSMPNFGEKILMKLNTSTNIEGFNRVPTRTEHYPQRALLPYRIYAILGEQPRYSIIINKQLPK